MKLLHIPHNTIRQQIQLHLPACVISSIDSIMLTQYFEAFRLTLNCVDFPMMKLLWIGINMADCCVLCKSENVFCIFEDLKMLSAKSATTMFLHAKHTNFAWSISPNSPHGRPVIFHIHCDLSPHNIYSWFAHFSSTSTEATKKTILRNTMWFTRFACYGQKKSSITLCHLSKR